MRLVYKLGTSPLYPVPSVVGVARLASVGDRVARRLAAELSIDEPRAGAYIRAGLARLTRAEFVITQTQTFDDGHIDADIYGVIDDEGHWFVKLYMANGRVIVTSWHEPTDELVRLDGKCIKR